MKKKHFLFFFSFLIFFGEPMFAQRLEKKQFDPTTDAEFIKEFFSIPEDVNKTSAVPYAIKDGKTLLMDVYQSKKISSEPQPVVIYLFGGAFRGGVRDNEYATFFCSRLAQRGITAISIDYRLGWRGRFKADFGDSEAMAEAKKIIQDPGLVDFTFDIAVEDVYSATNFIIKNAETLNINPSQISLSGSSAGALTSLRSEYYLKSEHPSAKKLPTEFKFNGVLAFAGAIYLQEGFPEYKTPPAPTLFIHGDQDLVVRYKGARLGKEGLYATKALVKQYKSHPDYNFQALIIKKGGHEDGCHKAVSRNFEDIYRFYQDYILNGKKGQEESVITYTKATTPYGTVVKGDEDQLVKKVFHSLLKR